MLPVNTGTGDSHAHSLALSPQHRHSLEQVSRVGTARGAICATQSVRVIGSIRASRFVLLHSACTVVGMLKIGVNVLGLLLLFVMPVAADDEAADETVEASVVSVSDADLGRPHTAAFSPLSGRDARSLFPSSKSPRKSDVNEWRSDFIQVDSIRTLQANARAWAIASGDLSVSSRKRFLVFRVRVVEHVLELDDTTEPRSLESTTNASYYLRKIYYGRMYEIIMSGSEDNLNASVAAGFQALGPKVGAKALVGRHKINVTQKAKGLKPTGEALFAQSVDEIKQVYQFADMGPAVPILVEYRRIPGSRVDARQDIDWTPPSTAPEKIKVRVVAVQGNNSDWTYAGLSVGPDDLVVGTATGKVHFGGWNGTEVEADAKSTGGLDMRVGTAPSAAGKTWTSVGGSGDVKFRVRDTKFTDNKGVYNIVLFVIPKALLLAGECQKQDADGSFVECGQL